MKRSVRGWMYRLVPLLVGGAIVLILLPAPPPPAGSASSGATTAEINLAAGIAPAAAAAPKPTDVSVTLAREDIGNAGAPASHAANWPQLTASVAAVATNGAPDPSNLRTDQVGSSAVNVRSDPSASSDKLFVLSPGEGVKVGETERGWTHIYRADGESGWVYGRYLASAAVATPDTVVATDTARASAPVAADNSDNLRGRFARIGGEMPVRAAPESGAPMLFMLDAGERVRISQSRGRWLQVVTEDGDSGWISS